MRIAGELQGDTGQLPGPAGTASAPTTCAPPAHAPGAEGSSAAANAIGMRECS